MILSSLILSWALSVTCTSIMPSYELTNIIKSNSRSNLATQTKVTLFTKILAINFDQLVEQIKFVDCSSLDNGILKLGSTPELIQNSIDWPDRDFMVLINPEWNCKLKDADTHYLLVDGYEADDELLTIQVQDAAPLLPETVDKIFIEISEDDSSNRNFRPDGFQFNLRLPDNTSLITKTKYGLKLYCAKCFIRGRTIANFTVEPTNGNWSIFPKINTSFLGSIEADLDLKLRILKPLPQSSFRVTILRYQLAGIYIPFLISFGPALALDGQLNTPNFLSPFWLEGGIDYGIPSFNVSMQTNETSHVSESTTSFFSKFHLHSLNLTRPVRNMDPYILSVELIPNFVIGVELVSLIKKNLRVGIRNKLEIGMHKDGINMGKCKVNQTRIEASGSLMGELFFSIGNFTKKPFLKQVFLDNCLGGQDDEDEIEPVLIDN